MLFDEALSAILANEGMATKTPAMAGYFARVPIPEDSSESESESESWYVGDADYCIEYVRPGVYGTVTYLVFQNGSEFKVERYSGSDVAFTLEFAAIVLSQDWYTCSKDECDEMLSKARTQRTLHVDEHGNVTVDESSVLPDGRCPVDDTSGMYDPSSGLLTLIY